MEGKMASVPVSAPLASAEINEVAGLHVDAAPTHISRK